MKNIDALGYRIAACVLLASAASWELSRFGIHATWHACLVAMLVGKQVSR